MVGNKPEAARRELAALGEALTQAERGAPRHSPAELMVWLLHTAALHPAAVADALLLQLCDVVSATGTNAATKVAIVRMGWAAIVQAEHKRDGLILLADEDAPRARAA